MRRMATIALVAALTACGHAVGAGAGLLVAARFRRLRPAPA